jgi:hypothetical protein
MWNDYTKGSNEKIKTENVRKLPFNAASVASVRKTERSGVFILLLFPFRSPLCDLEQVPAAYVRQSVA